MTAKTLMSTDPFTLTPEVSVAAALQAMCEHKVHNIPVVDRNGAFVGLFSLRRIAQALLPMAAQMGADHLREMNVAFLSDNADAYLERLLEIGHQPISELLEKKKKLRFCEPDTPIPRILQLLSENPTSLPVLVVQGKQREVVGMVSTWDVLTKITSHLFSDDASDRSDDHPAKQ